MARSATPWSAGRTNSQAPSASAWPSRALSVQSCLIVGDEPTSALEVSLQGQTLHLLRELQRELQRELGVGYLFLTHSIGAIEYIADRVAAMRGG